MLLCCYNDIQCTCNKVCQDVHTAKQNIFMHCSYLVMFNVAREGKETEIHLPTGPVYFSFHLPSLKYYVLVYTTQVNSTFRGC